MDPSRPSKDCPFARDRRQCLSQATKVQQQSSSILPSYPKNFLVEQETAQRDPFSHRDFAPSGTRVRSGSPGVVGGPRLLLYGTHRAGVVRRVYIRERETGVGTSPCLKKNNVLARN